MCPARHTLRGIFVATLALLIPLQAQETTARKQRLQYEAEWRLIRAGTATVTLSGQQQIELKLNSTGLVDKLIHIEDTYRAEFDSNYCAATSTMDAREGRRHRKTDVTFNRETKRASYLETDLVKNTIVRQQEIDIPACVHDPLSALEMLRGQVLETGKTLTVAVSDGRKSIQARVDVLGKETIKTKVGEFRATKIEAFLFNGLLYGRKGRLFVWISDDERRLPVQVRIQMPFYIGTVTLKLEKIDIP